MSDMGNFNSLQKAITVEMQQNFKPLLYNIWNLPKQTITDIVNNGEKGHLSDFAKTFKPLLYNIWNLPKQNNNHKHFKTFPFADNKYNG